MNTRGDCPDSLRRTALSWALQVPPDGRTQQRHEHIVWCNFCDVFTGRWEFERLVIRRRFFQRNLASQNNTEN